MLARTHKSFALMFTSASLLIYDQYQAITEQSDILLSDPLGLPTIICLLLSYTFGSVADLDNISSNVKHRGFTHSIFMIGTLWMITMLTTSIPILYISSLALSLAWTSHCIGDAFSVAGVEWFYPFRTYITYPNGATFKRGKRIIFPKLYKVGDNALRWYRQGTYELVTRVPFVLPAHIQWLIIAGILLLLRIKGA